LKFQKQHSQIINNLQHFGFDASLLNALKALRASLWYQGHLNSINVYPVIVKLMKKKRIGRKVVRKVSRAAKIDAVVLDAKGEHSQEEVATVMNMHVKTLQRAKAKLKKDGDVEGGSNKRGPKGKLHYTVKNVGNLPLLRLSKLRFADIVGTCSNGLRGARLSAERVCIGIGRKVSRIDYDAH
jgi:hypothetical protein